MLSEIVASEAGAVVKTIGDAVMATFPTPDRALAAALRMRDSIKDIRDGDLLIKIGIHEGPCLAVTLNDRLDYFGQTVNIAARVQSLADAKAIFATKPVVENPQVAKMLETGKHHADRAARRACAVSPTRWRCFRFRSLELSFRRSGRESEIQNPFGDSAGFRARSFGASDDASQNFIQSPDRSNAALAR